LLFIAISLKTTRARLRTTVRQPRLGWDRCRTTSTVLRIRSTPPAILTLIPAPRWSRTCRSPEPWQFTWTTTGTWTLPQPRAA